MNTNLNHTSLAQAAEILKTEEFAAFADAVRATFARKGFVFLSGSGDTGRVGIRLERAWRKALNSLMEKYPQVAPALEEKLVAVRNVDMAGEYAVIESPAFLSQNNAYGRGMMRANGLGFLRKDLFLGIDPTADTPSTLGSCHYALIHLVDMYMLTCVKPEVEKNRSTKEVFTHPYCRYLTAPDLRVLEIICAVALEAALWDILEANGIPNEFPGYAWFADKLTAMKTDARLDYAGRTLCADEYLIDTLCFTAEHPQFQAKNPNYETEEAWERCFLRKPRCMEWTGDFYQSLGLSDQQIKSLPNLTSKGLTQIPIGKESLTEQDALMVDSLLDGCDLPLTHMEIFQHLTINQLLESLVNE